MSQSQKRNVTLILGGLKKENMTLHMEEREYLTTQHENNLHK